MRRTTKAIMIVIACAGATGVIGLWIYFSNYKRESPYPDTVPAGILPTMYLPIKNFSNLTMITGYGEVEPGRIHSGIDFTVNDTTQIVAPCNAYVSYIDANWYNEVGPWYQTNIHLRLNSEWTIVLLWESGAQNATFGAYQVGNITVHLGDYVSTNQSIGNLLHQGDASQLHLGICANNVWECPYRFFNCSARVLFEEQFDRVGLNWYSSCYCCD